MYNKLKTIFSFDKDRGDIYKQNSTIRGDSDIIIPVTKNSATKVQSIDSDDSVKKYR